jgi:hypothetical protein
MPIAFTNALHGQFTIDHGNDDTVIRWLKSPVHDQEVTTMDTCPNHRVALHLDEECGGLVFDEMLVQVKFIFEIIIGW